jgi:hypothetical protein
MQRICIILLIVLHGVLKAQPKSSVKQSDSSVNNPNARFVGKYQFEGLLIQFAIQKDALVLIVPGAPIQELKSAGKNKFKSVVYEDGLYTFSDDGEKVAEVTIEEKRGVSKGKKIGSEVTLLSIAMDSLLVLTKSTKHFSFRYSAIDSVSVDTIANDMEKNYKRILTDFKIKQIPHVTVRIYPDLQSFHNGINLPNGPDQVLATAFGKDDIRMVSPNNAGPEAWMLAYAAPHEFTHVVHLNIDYSPNNPRWLWEGVAQYEARWFFNPGELDIIRKKEFPSLSSLNNGMEYMLGYSIIEAIKDRWGFDTVIQLIKNQGDVKKVLKIDEKVFEEEVFNRIYKKYIH